MDTVPQTLPFSKGREAFELAARVEGRSHKTFLIYRYVLGSFQAWLGQRDLCQVDAGLLRAYLAHLQTRMRPASVHHHFRGLHAFFSFLHREEFLPKNPIGQIRAPKLRDYFPEVFSEDEIHRLLATPNRRASEGLPPTLWVLLQHPHQLADPLHGQKFDLRRPAHLFWRSGGES